jgi:hypothetical protein
VTQSRQPPKDRTSQFITDQYIPTIRLFNLALAPGHGFGLAFICCKVASRSAQASPYSTGHVWTAGYLILIPLLARQSPIVDLYPHFLFLQNLTTNLNHSSQSTLCFSNTHVRRLEANYHKRQHHGFPLQPQHVSKCSTAKGTFWRTSATERTTKWKI